MTAHNTPYEKLSQERKEGQARGDIPEWMTTAGWQMFKERYLYQADSVREQLDRIAKTAANHLPSDLRDKAYDEFFKLLWNGWLSASTPVLANMGTNRGLPVSCSGSVIEDSIDGFYTAAHEAALLTKHGFGTSSYLGNIRPRGSAISTGGKASGVVPVFKHFVNIMRDVSQAGIRRGSWAGYLPIDHPDFDELCDYVKDNPDDANVGWNISNEFIERLEKQDQDAIRRYQKAMKLRMLGKGYFCFIDKMNEANPPMYKEHGLSVKASNLCLSGDTLVVIRNRMYASKEVIMRLDKFVKMWQMNNGSSIFEIWAYDETKKAHCWKEVTNAAMTNPKAEVVELRINNKRLLTATKDHKIYTVNRGWVPAGDITPEDELFLEDSRKITGVEVVHSKKKIPVYDLTVPGTHNFFANGILVHNCSEISLHADEEHTFTCVLSSMNIAKYDEWKNTDAVFWATVFLDCVCSEFIERAKEIKGLEKAVRMTEKGRAIGLGAMGLHTLFMKRGIPFGSMESFLLNGEIFKHISDEAHRASRWMAEKLGEPEWCKGYGVRNTHLLAIAPNKSTALILGGVSEGINPDPAMVYTQTTAAGEVFRINPIFLELMKERGKYKKSVLADICDHFGSVQHLDWLTDDEKLVFRTAFEINQENIVHMAAARQNFVCQSQSLNLFFSADEEERWISHVHKLAFDSNIKALYYVTTMTGVQPNRDCLSCEG